MIIFNQPIRRIGIEEKQKCTFMSKGALLFFIFVFMRENFHKVLDKRNCIC